MKRSVPLSGTVNSTYPSPEEIDCDEMAPASGHPPHPPDFLRLLPIVDAFTTSVQLTGDVLPPVDVGAGGVVGRAAEVSGANRARAGGTGVGVEPDPGSGAPDVLAPRRWSGTFTMNASLRFVPPFVVQMKYSPVMSRLPFGNFQ